ncbi:MAG TPA: tetratricopeptide repeat protein [Flavipsychrobacter sp.]|nr:tetratricopeptide repeat protein [Flavipsychrobacter sp.]
MRPIHYITIAAAVALIAILYFGGNIVPPKKEGANTPVASGNTPHSVAPASFDSILSVARQQLPAHAAEEIKTIETQLAAIRDSSRMAVVFDTLAKVWQRHKQGPVAAYYYLLAAKLDNSEKKLTFAAQLFLDLARKANSESAQAWSGQMAIDGFNRVLSINPGNDTAKVLLAECYIGTGQTMDGVMMLREVTEKDPNNVPANLILGQQGIVSGQLDKAMARFETVLKQEPRNIEALLGLAEAYKNDGDKEKAINLLEQSKQVMNNPEFSKDIDAYIKSFK